MPVIDSSRILFQPGKKESTFSNISFPFTNGKDTFVRSTFVKSLLLENLYSLQLLKFELSNCRQSSLIRSTSYRNKNLSELISKRERKVT